MTTVTIDSTKRIVRITAKDHAYGNDKVCNGISTLLLTLESYLVNNPERISKHKSHIEPGDIEIMFAVKRFEMYAILEFVIIGLLQIENEYGNEFISVNVSDEINSLMGGKFSTTSVV